MIATQLYLKIAECPMRIIVLQGGGDSLKTVSILKRLCVMSISRGKQISTVVGHTVPAIRAGALRAFQRYVLPDFEKYVVKYNETERVYVFHNKSILEFRSYEDELSAQGAERDNLFLNEANHIAYQIFWQLQRKTREQIFIDYNPTSAFWVHEKLLNKETPTEFTFQTKLFISYHRYNPYLTEEEHQRYESIVDPEMFKVYARGRTGKVSGLIFGHFKKWDSNELPEAARIFWGLDYGYTNDPTALIKIAVNGRQRISKEFTYTPGIAAETLKNIIIYNGSWNDSQLIYSEADPNMINQLRNLGLPVHPAIKGAGSIAAGIAKVREHECFYTPDSTNFEKEIMTYKWSVVQDLITGKEVTTNVPVDAWNHCCDAFRYGDYTDSFRFRL